MVNASVKLTNTQIDKIGSKLKAGELDADCLRNLELFRSLYVDSYRYVENILVDKMGCKITGRPSKSTVAITEKLKRETIRLNQIQDIAGCRVLVPDLASQDRLVENMLVMFAEVEVDDKRKLPTNGYRAVHVIARKFNRPVEIQVRTALQHFWAEISEKVADDVGHSVKYGKGDTDAIRFLYALSNTTEELEKIRHQRQVMAGQKALHGKSRSLVSEIKKLNELERIRVREVRSIFSGKY